MSSGQLLSQQQGQVLLHTELALPCHTLMANPFLTALQLKEELGTVTITHPFHPLSGKELKILKTRKIAGKIFLVLQSEQIGIFNIPTEWTNYFSADQEKPVIPGAYISVESLFALCELVYKKQ